MHIDTRDLQDESLIEGDICIIGSGAAGISLALEWVGRNETVILLESGGFDLEAPVQALNHGGSVGQRYYSLGATRLRYVGGTTGNWYGFCAPLDDVDFKKRDWVPHSGWPFEKAELDPYYARAHELVELGPYEFDPAYWELQNQSAPRMAVDDARVRTKIWQFSPPTRFGDTYRQPLIDAENIALYTHATVCGLVCNEGVNTVTEATVKTLEGASHTVRARHFILACGAIQNARLLLASNSQAKKGLGNDNDLVGRYFMEHPEVRIAMLNLAERLPLDLYHFNWFKTKVRGELGVTEALQEEHGLLNCTLSLWPGRFVNTLPSIESFPKEAAGTLELRDQRRKSFEAGRLRDIYMGSRREYLLFTRLEQAPNPKSRVTLAEETDALGMPLARLDWQLSPLDKHTLLKTAELIGQEMGRAEIGRLQVAGWLFDESSEWAADLSGHWDHAGTTRMHDDPQQGVVDANGKVHGIDNLYVASSSTFPTSGTAGSTLTLIALALRLSDHVKNMM